MLEHRGDGCGGFIRDKYSVLPPGPRDKSRFHVTFLTEPITTGYTAIRYGRQLEEN